MNETESTLYPYVIQGYRALINDRYQYNRIDDKYDLPSSFDEDRVERFRNYFLEYIYPDIEKRNELNAAFESLDDYIKHPTKLMRILLDSASVVFKYGRHLPKILSAGLRALSTFRSATKFEEQLVNQAISLDLKPPFSHDKMHQMLKGLSKKEVEVFIGNSTALFETMNDRKLVVKIIDIVNSLIAKMKKRPKIYAQTELNGLIIGLEIISNGNAIFSELNDVEQKQILDFVVKIEKSELEEILRE